MDEAGVSHGTKQREAAPQSAKAFCEAHGTLHARLSEVTLARVQGSVQSTVAGHVAGPPGPGGAD
jgi:hypothetical protein